MKKNRDVSKDEYSISIKWTLVSAGLEKVAFSKLYSVYPSPTSSTIYVSGMDITEIEICTIAYKQVLTSKLQNIDLSSFPNGIYLAIIKTKNGTAEKRIIKQ